MKSLVNYNMPINESSQVIHEEDQPKDETSFLNRKVIGLPRRIIKAHRN